MKYSVFLVMLNFIIALQTAAHVKLTYPTGDEVFSQNNTVNIEWDELVTHNTLNWDLYFSDDGGDTWEEIKADIPYGTNNYNWTVPEIITTKARIKIVQDNEALNYEDISGNFTISATTSAAEQASKEIVKVYPNPFIFSATISFNNPEQETHTLFIYDTKGRMAKNATSFKNDRISITRDGLKSGLYYFQLRNDNKLKHSGKLVVK